MALDREFFPAISALIESYALKMASMYMNESQRREESYVQDGDRQLLRCLCNEVLGPLVEVSVQKADKKYACTVETDECCVKVSGASDVVLKAGKISGMQEAKLFKLPGLTIQANMLCYT